MKSANLAKWLATFLFISPAFAQASLITIEYSGVITSSMENRPGRDVFSYEIGDRINGVAVIDLSKGVDELPQSSEARYRNQPDEGGLLQNTFTPPYVTEHLDSVSIQDNVLYSGEMVDRITLNDRALYYRDLGNGGYENSDFSVSLYLIFNPDTFTHDNLHGVRSGDYLPVLAASSGAASMSWMHYSDQMVGGAFTDGIDFSIDSVKIRRSYIPEPSALALMMLAIAGVGHRRRNS